MIRQPEREQLNRLTVKTLDQIFVMRGKEGQGCSQFEAEALANLVTAPQVTKQPTTHRDHSPARSWLSIFHITLLGELQLGQGLRRCCTPIYGAIIPQIETLVKFTIGALAVAT